MRILITGINGFIGQHLATALTKRGHFVVGIGRRGKPKVSKISAYYSKTVLEKEIVEKASFNIEVFVHLAALTSHKDIVDNKFKTLETNFFGTKNVLDAFKKSKSAKKFLYPSTGKVYGKIVNLPISEDHPANPLNILGKSKLITEKLIDFYSSSETARTKPPYNDDQKEFIIFRIFNVYGQGQNENFLIPTILKQLSNGRNEITLGDIKAKRDYVFIDDLVNAFVSAIESGGQPGLSIYNICTRKGTSAWEIVNLINKIKGVDIKVKANPTLLRLDEMENEYGSYDKAKKMFGWEPKVSLWEGLAGLLKK